MRKTLFSTGARLLVLCVMLVLLAGCASLTGARSCSCEHNSQTGITKWECESGAVSENAKIQFTQLCGFEAGATGAEQGRAVIDAAVLAPLLRSIIAGGGTLEDPGR